MSWVWVIAGIVFLLILWGMYARTISTKNRANEAFSSIDVQLQKRRDLLPPVLKIAKRYIDHENDLLKELVALREESRKITQSSSMDDKMKLDQKVSSLTPKIFALAEDYPDLKAAGPLIEAQKTYVDVEENLAASRRFYNASVRELQDIIDTFPYSIFANMVGARPMPYFEASEDAAKPVEPNQYL